MAVRSLLALVDVVIGADDRDDAAVLARPDELRIERLQATEAQVAGDADAAIELCRLGPRLLVRKRGAGGSRPRLQMHGSGPVQRTDVAGFPVEVVNVLGAGDAFAAGFIYGCLNGWEAVRAARFLGNARGAPSWPCARLLGLDADARRVRSFIAERDPAATSCAHRLDEVRTVGQDAQIGSIGARRDGRQDRPSPCWARARPWSDGKRTRSRADWLEARAACRSPRRPGPCRALEGRLFDADQSARAVQEVLRGEDGLLPELQVGAVLVEMSAIDPDASRALAQEVNDAGGQMLDCPVSGGVGAIAGGDLR